jgi:hypothetical protein
MTSRQIQAALFHLDRLDGQPADPHRLAPEALLLDVLRVVEGPHRAEAEEERRAKRRS